MIRAILTSCIGLGCVASGALAANRHEAATGRAARDVYLSEIASLHLVHNTETTLVERGTGLGTFRASLVASLTFSPERVNGVFTVYPSGGSITGRASARYIVRGSTGYYGGTLTIIKGTGRYRHATGTNLGISGTISRRSFALTVKAHGWMRY